MISLDTANLAAQDPDREYVVSGVFLSAVLDLIALVERIEDDARQIRHIPEALEALEDAP